TDPDGRQAESSEAMERMIEERMAARRAALAAGDAAGGLGIASLDPRAELSRRLTDDVRAAPEQRLRGTLRSLFRLRLGEQVARLPMPVLLACGDADQIIPIERLLETWAKYPRGTGLQV